MRLKPLFLVPAAAALVLGAAVSIAQIEGSGRGVAPVDSSSDYEVSGVRVDVAAIADIDPAGSGGPSSLQVLGGLLAALQAVEERLERLLPLDEESELVNTIVERVEADRPVHQPSPTDRSIKYPPSGSVQLATS